jgi:hypothetical protein
MQSLVRHDRQISRTLVRNPATEPIDPTVPIRVVSGQTYRQNVRRSNTKRFSVFEI